MAQIINYYVAYTNTRCYIYPSSAWNTSGILQLEADTQVTLYVNSAGNGVLTENGFYRVRTPQEGWIQSWEVSNITPSTTTTTDVCKPPTSVTLDVNAKKLTITGGSGGDLNTFTGWGVSWRERNENGTTWGAWSADTVTTSNVVTVSVNAGKVRQFRVRTRGSAGSNYYSAYVVCPTLLVGITACKAPTNITATSYNPAPGTGVTIQWTGAEAGVSNPITGYELYRVTGPDPTDFSTLVATIETTETSGSYSTTFNLSVGEKNYFRVKTLGTVDGYDSGLSSFVLEITGGYGNVVAPTKLWLSSAVHYPKGIASLHWSGAANGYENELTGYQVYRSTNATSGFTLIENVSGADKTNAFVTAPASTTTTYYYKIRAVGNVEGYNSWLSEAIASLSVVAYAASTTPFGRTNAVAPKMQA